MDIQDIEDIAHEDRLQYTVERKKDCGPSKDIGYISSIPADSILEDKDNQRDHVEQSNTEENYSIVSIESELISFFRLAIDVKYIGKIKDLGPWLCHISNKSNKSECLNW